MHFSGLNSQLTTGTQGYQTHQLHLKTDGIYYSAQLGNLFAAVSPSISLVFLPSCSSVLVSPGFGPQHRARLRLVVAFVISQTRRHAHAEARQTQKQAQAQTREYIVLSPPYYY